MSLYRQGDALEDVGDRVRCRAVCFRLCGNRVEAQGQADDDRADVEGSCDPGDDRDDRERIAVVGARQVEVAGDPGEHSPHSRSVGRRADLARGRAGGVGLLFVAAVGAGARDRPGDVCVRAFGDSDQRCQEPLRQRGRDLGQVLVAVLSRQAHDQGRVGACGVVQGSRFEAGVEGQVAGGAGSSVHSPFDLHVGGLYDRVVGFGERVELRRGGVGAALGWGHQDSSCAFFEVQGRVGVGKRRQAFEGRHQAAGVRVGFDPARLLDQYAPFLGPEDQVDRQEGAFGVLVGTRQIQRSGDRFVGQRRVGDDRAELGGFRAARPWGGVDLLGAELGFGAGRETFCGRWVGADAFGQCDFHLCGLGFGDPSRAGQAFVRQLQLEVEARGGGCRLARRRRGDLRREGDRGAALGGGRFAAGVERLRFGGDVVAGVEFGVDFDPGLDRFASTPRAG